MLVLRCTRKLLRCLGRRSVKDEETLRSTTRLGDWHANRLIVSRQHLVLAVSSKTLLPVVVAAAPYKSAALRIAQGTCELLRALCVDETKIAAEAQAMREIAIAPTHDLRVLGSMNDFARGLDWYLQDRTPAEVSLLLTETPCGPLGMQCPREATRKLFATS